MPIAVRTKKFIPKPANPQADPRFKNVKNKIIQKANELKKHPSSKQKANEAAKAAKGPPNEKSAGGKAKQVDKLKDTKAETPPADSFLTALRAEIEKVMPSIVEDADKFMEGGAESEMKSAVGGNVKDQKQTASGDLETASKAPPNEGGVPIKTGEAIPPDPNVPASPVNGAAAMPAPKSDAEISQKQTKADAQTALKENRLEGKRLENKHPAFEKVKAEKGNVDRTADASPAKFRAGEKQTLGKAAAQANVAGKTGMSAVVSVKNKSKSAVQLRQEQQKKDDEKRRKDVTDRIEKIYTGTKEKVDKNLNSLERDVMAVFDPGASAAISAFENNTRRDTKKFFKERYSGIIGAAEWVKDLFKPAPPEVKQIVQANLKIFTKSMDNLAVKIAAMVDKRLNQAKSDISSGQAEIKAYVAGLPKDLKSVGQQAEKAMDSRFNEMSEGVEAKKNDLAQKLAQKYKDAHDKANEIGNKIEAENEGAFKKLADAVGEVIKIILEFKDKLMALLKKAADTIDLILDDPVGFLGNLIGAIKLGVNQFVGNIWTHLKAGFMKWLFGSLADAGIEIPSDLSLVSLFKMVMSVLGLTIPRLKAKAIKLLGPTAVAVIGKLIEYVSALITGGPAKLWEQVKADVGDLKAMIIDAIQNWLIDTVIKQATIKLLSFFNPAGAFVQAVIAIYNTVMFIIENAAKIMAFVEAVINSVSSIAQGAIGAAASWIEKSLAGMIPLLIGFLARLIGLGGLSKKVKEFITKVQDKVDKAIDKVIGKIVQTVKKLFGKLTGKSDKKESKEESEKRLNEALKASKTAVAKYRGKRVGALVLKPILAGIRLRYKLKTLVPVERGDKLIIHGEINPVGDIDPDLKPGLPEEVEAAVKTAKKLAAKVKKDAANAKKAQKSGAQREKQRIKDLKAREAAGEGKVIPTKPSAKGIDTALLRPDDTLEIIEVKAGGEPRTFKERSSSRKTPKGKTPETVASGAEAARAVTTDPALGKRVATGKTVLVTPEGKVIQNQLSAITENLKANVIKMMDEVQKAVSSGKLDPAVQTKLQEILAGKAGTIKVILDVQKGSTMSADQFAAAEAMINHAFNDLMGRTSENLIKIQVVKIES